MSRAPDADAALAAAVAEELPWSAAPEQVFRLVADRPFAQFLDSSDSALGRWSILVSEPFATLDRRALRPRASKRELQALLRPLTAPPGWREDISARLQAEPPPFLGGAVGLFGGATAAEPEQLLRLPRRQAGMILGLYDSLLAFDHHSGRVFSVSTGLREADPQARARLCRHWAERWRRRMAAAAAAPPAPPTPLGNVVWSSNFARSGYEAAVARIIRHIRAGDISQAGLWRRFDLRFAAAPDPFGLYAGLRRAFPAPFAACLNLGETVVLSAAPERFVETRDGQIRALAVTAGNRAEHAVAIDQLRNDLSKLALPHSLGAARLGAARPAADANRLVSTLAGRLRPGLDGADLLADCLPAAALAGAPRRRALQIAAGLEAAPGGACGAAIGWLGFDGNMDSSLAAPAVCVSGRDAMFHAGGVVTLESDPAKAWEATEAEARRMAEALGTTPERGFEGLAP